MVVPVWTGGGTNIKVAEALTYGRTCVVSRPAHRGYANILRDAESLMVGSNTQEMAAHCIELLREPERRARLAETGAHALASVCSFEHFQQEVIRTVELAFRIFPRLSQK